MEGERFYLRGPPSSATLRARKISSPTGGGAGHRAFIFPVELFVRVARARKEKEKNRQGRWAREGEGRIKHKPRALCVESSAELDGRVE